MSCEKVQKLISPLLDRKVAGRERESLLAHLASCGSCAHRLQVLESLRSELRRMAAPAIPPYLAQKLRVLASDERARQAARATGAGRLEHWTVRLQLFFDNLMRPVALPFAGGLLSALVVFSLIFLPSFRAAGPLGFDPSIELVTLADGIVVGAPGETPGEILRGPALPCDEAIVELTIDATGNVRDWNMVRGQMTQDIKNMIVYSQFTPATYFGRPVQSKVQVALHTVDRETRT
jgi:hypothetical protein